MIRTKNVSAVNSATPGLATCPHCQSLATLFQEQVKDHVVGVEGSWNLYQCSQKNCELVFVFPQPDENQLRAYYQHYITHESPDLSLPSSPKGFGPKAWLKRMQAHRDREFVFLNQGPFARVLEIGCGNGSNLFKLRTLGWQIAGQEVDPPAVAQARKLGIDVHQGDLAKLDRSDSYERIILVHVIEHLLQPAEILQQAWRLLAPQGQLVIITPNPRSIGRRLFKRFWIPLAQPFHVRLYNLNCLRRLTSQVGFKPLRYFTNSTHSGPNVRASIEAYRQSGAFAGSLLRFRVLPLILEMAILSLHLLADSFKKEVGDECILICEKSL